MKTSSNWYIALTHTITTLVGIGIFSFFAAAGIGLGGSEEVVKIGLFLWINVISLGFTIYSAKYVKRVYIINDSNIILKKSVKYYISTVILVTLLSINAAGIESFQYSSGLYPSILIFYFLSKKFLK